MITIKDVEHVAKLARLELTEEEKETFSKQLDAILEHMNKLNEIDTTNIEPMAHAFPIKNVMREDVVVQDFTREEMLANAPDEEDGFFKVPKMSD